MGDKQQRAALCNRGKGRGEVKGSSERSSSEEKRKTNGIVGMRSIWFYCLSGKVQERGIAKGEALHFYEEAIELHFLPWDGSIHSKSASPVIPNNQTRSHSIRSHWKTRGSPRAGSLLPSRASQSPEHCMAGARWDPCTSSCLSQGLIFRHRAHRRCSSGAVSWGVLPTEPQCTHQPVWTQTNQSSSSKPGQKMMFSRVQEQRKGL